jgi:putative ABC transport system permease protein
VRSDLLADWRRSLPMNVPNNFLINIRPEERQSLEDFLNSRGLGRPQMYPMVRARMAAINGEAVDKIKLKGEGGRGFLEREQNLTWTPTLMDDNQLIAGRWWTRADYGNIRRRSD